MDTNLLHKGMVKFRVFFSQQTTKTFNNISNNQLMVTLLLKKNRS